VGWATQSPPVLMIVANWGRICDGLHDMTGSSLVFWRLFPTRSRGQGEALGVVGGFDDPPRGFDGRRRVVVREGGQGPPG